MIRLLLLAACALPRAAAADTMDRVAAATLSYLQSYSFEANREYCGLLGRLPDGRIVASPARRGGVDSCTPGMAADWQPRAEIVASYHTHGAFDPEADAEVPSIEDIMGDVADGVDGYISTPGGRLWFVDGDRVEARLLCGIGCLPQDPAFRPGIWGPIAERYTPATLRRRDREGP